MSTRGERTETPVLREAQAKVLVSGHVRRGRLILSGHNLSYTPDLRGELDRDWVATLDMVKEALLVKVPQRVEVTGTTGYVTQLKIELFNGEIASFYVRRTALWVEQIRKAMTVLDGEERPGRVTATYSPDPVRTAPSSVVANNSLVPPIVTPFLVIIFWPLGLFLAVRGWKRTAASSAAGKTYRVATVLGIADAAATAIIAIVRIHGS